MFLFPVDGILEVVLSYGQMISLFLVFVIFEGMIAAKSETAKPGLVFIFLVFLLAEQFLSRYRQKKTYALSKQLETAREEMGG